MLEVMCMADTAHATALTKNACYEVGMCGNHLGDHRGPQLSVHFFFPEP